MRNAKNIEAAEAEGDEEVDAELAAKKAARRAARAALATAGFEGTGRWLTLRKGKVTFEAKGRTDGQIQLFAVTDDARKFVGTVQPRALAVAMRKAVA